MMPGPIGLLTLTFFLVLVPWGAFRARGRVAQMVAMPRVRYHQNVIVQQLFFAVLAGLAIWGEHLDIRAGRVDPLALLAAAGLLALAILGMRPRWRAAVERNEPRLQLFAPRTGEERFWWAMVSLAAGVCEELVWRGVVAGLLWWIAGSWWAAALITSFTFGVAHALQGLKSAAIIALFALAMQAFVHWTGGLLLAMAIHAIYDVTAGFTYGRLMAARESSAQ